MHKALDAPASDMECGQPGRSTPDCSARMPAMSETIERAKETVAEAHHAHGDTGAQEHRHSDCGACSGTGVGRHGRERRAQNAYLTHHIAVSDDWAFYQAKNMRATVLFWAAQAGVLANLPNAADAGPQAEIKRARDNEARMRDDPQGGDGMKQLAERAKGQEAERDAAFHRSSRFELVVGALQIAIVLA